MVVRLSLSFVLGVVLLVTPMLSAVANTSVGSMSQQADVFYTLTKEGKFLEARSSLWQLTTTFSRFNWEDMDVSVEGIHALSEALIDARHSLARMEVDEHEVQMQAIQVRLGIDALKREEQPLWHRYYNVFKKDITHLEEVVPTGDKKDVQQAIDRLYAHYQLIQPALYIDRTANAVEQVNALFAYMNEQIHDVSMDRERLEEAVGRWRDMLVPLFYGSDEDVLAVAMPPGYPIVYPTWFLAILIGTVLTYVAWRKAQAEQTKQYKRKSP